MSVLHMAYWGFTLRGFQHGLYRRAYQFADTTLWSA